MTSNFSPATFCRHLARVIASETGVWYGAMDVANALARGLRGERLAGPAAVSMMVALSRGNGGLRATPDRLAEVAAALNRLADTDRVTEATVHTALAEVMGLSYPVVVVAVSPKGELSFETAGSLAELMKRRAVATMRERARVVAQAERRAA